MVEKVIQYSILIATFRKAFKNRVELERSIVVQYHEIRWTTWGLHEFFNGETKCRNYIEVGHVVQNQTSRFEDTWEALITPIELKYISPRWLRCDHGCYHGHGNQSRAFGLQDPHVCCGFDHGHENQNHGDELQLRHAYCGYVHVLWSRNRDVSWLTIQW